MIEKSLTLRADLVERLESIALIEDRSVDDVVAALLEQQTPSEKSSNWALHLAETMAAANIVWQDVPELSASSRDVYQDAVYRQCSYNGRTNGD